MTPLHFVILLSHSSYLPYPIWGRWGATAPTLPEIAPTREQKQHRMNNLSIDTPTERRIGGEGVGVGRIRVLQHAKKKTIEKRCKVIGTSKPANQNIAIDYFSLQVGDKGSPIEKKGAGHIRTSISEMLICSDRDLGFCPRGKKGYI